MGPGTRLRALAAAVALAAAAGCDRSNPAAAGEDRTVQRLQEEAAARARAQTAQDRLAEAAVAPPEAARQSLPVPRQPRAALGALQLEVAALAASQVVPGGKVSLATADRFLQVQLAVKNAGREPAAADLTQAVLVGSGQQTWGIARDVQRLAGTRVLHARLGPGESRDFVLFFEVPEAALTGGGLRLAAAGGNADGVISLD